MEKTPTVWSKLLQLLASEPSLGQQCREAGSFDEALKLMQDSGARLGISLGWTELAEAMHEAPGSTLADEALDSVSAGVGVSDNLVSLLSVLQAFSGSPKI